MIIELLKPIKVIVQLGMPIENIVDQDREEFLTYLTHYNNLTTNKIDSKTFQYEFVCDKIDIQGKIKQIYFITKQKEIATPYHDFKFNLDYEEIEDLNVFIYSNNFILTEVITNNKKQKTVVRTNRIKSWEKDYRKDLVEQQFKRALDPNFGNDWEKINLNQFKSLF